MNPFAYCYAKFLVEISPEDAINMIWEGSKRGEIKLDEWVDKACTRLGGRSVHAIRGMIEDRQWDELKAFRQFSSPSAMTPREYRIPPTPSSTASGSLQLQPKSYDGIWVYHLREAPAMLMAKPSGSQYYFIGEDKLERFQGITPEWINHPQKVTLGGQVIDVAKNVRLTWNRPEDSGTMYEQFWVVRPELIRGADVLLGDRDQRFGVARNKGSYNCVSLKCVVFGLGACSAAATNKTLTGVNSPLSLDPQSPYPGQVPPPVPSPPQHRRFHQQSSTAIYSVQGSPPETFDQGSHRDFGIRNHQHPRPSATTDTMTSELRSVYNSVESRSSSITEQPPSSPQSVSSSKTAKPPRSNIVTVQISFQGVGKRISGLDLTKSADGVISYLQPHVLRISGQQLDREVHELTITPVKGTEADSQSYSLREDELDCTWDAMVEFIRENRAVESKKQEFLLDIG